MKLELEAVSAAMPERFSDQRLKAPSSPAEASPKTLQQAEAQSVSDKAKALTQL